jgi:hypothetical protein
MTTFTPQETPLDARVRDAWSAYRHSTAELAGQEYDATEAESWELLQERLRAIEADRVAAAQHA